MTLLPSCLFPIPFPVGSGSSGLWSSRLKARVAVWLRLSWWLPTRFRAGRWFPCLLQPLRQWLRGKSEVRATTRTLSAGLQAAGQRLSALRLEVRWCPVRLSLQLQCRRILNLCRRQVRVDCACCCQAVRTEPFRRGCIRRCLRCRLHLLRPRCPKVRPLRRFLRCRATT